MPIVHANTKVFGYLLKNLGSIECPVCLLALGRGLRLITGGSAVLLHRGKNRCTAKIRWIWPPFAFRDFDGNQACQALLLPRPGQGRILAPNCHCRRRYGVLGNACSGAAECRFHGLDVVIVPPTGVVIVVMRIEIIARRVDASGVGTFIPVMLWHPRLAPISFNSLPLNVPVLSFLFPLHLSWIMRL